MKPVSNLSIFGTYHESGLQIHCAKYEHSVVNRQPVRDHHNFDPSFSLKVTLNRALKSLCIKLERCLKGLFNMLNKLTKSLSNSAYIKLRNKSKV